MTTFHLFSNGVNTFRSALSALLIAGALALPITVSAQSSDQILLDLLKALEGTGEVPVQTAATTSTTTAATPAPKPKTSTSYSTAVVPPPVMPVLGPSFVFSIDGNQPAADPTVEAMKATLASLTAKFLSLSASSSMIAASNATSSPATTTAPAPKKTFLRDLTVGSRGEDVRQLQTLLIARGFLFGEVTGYFGILTKTAVIAFQTDNGLPPVGNVGPKTRAVLNDLPQGAGEELKDLIIGPPARPRIASSTSATMNASSTATSTPMGTSTPQFDSFYPPVSVSMSVLPSEAPVGGSVAVTWLSQNATSCQASDGWDGPRATLGAAKIEPLQFTLDLVLTCTGPGGIASTSALVVVGGEQ